MQGKISLFAKVVRYMSCQADTDISDSGSAVMWAAVFIIHCERDRGIYRINKTCFVHAPNINTFSDYLRIRHCHTIT